MNIGLSFAGAFVCITIALLNLRHWWNGNRELKGLLPFAQSTLMGALATLCSSGLLGWLSGCTRQGVSAVGDKGVAGLTGTSGGAPVAARSLAGQLTPEGAVVVAVAAALTVVAYKAASKEDKRRMTGGLLCGMCLTITAGFAAGAEGLPGLVNEAGVAGRRLFEMGAL
jgi:hypothetical protein